MALITFSNAGGLPATEWTGRRPDRGTQFRVRAPGGTVVLYTVLAVTVPLRLLVIMAEGQGTRTPNHINLAALGRPDSASERASSWS